MRQGQQLCFHGWAAQVENPFAEVSGSTRVYPALVHAELTPDSPNVQRTYDCPIPGNVQGWMGLGAAWGGGGRWQGWNWIGFKFLLSSQPNHAVIAIVAPSSFCWSHFEFAFLVASHHVLPWQSPSLETHCPGKTALIFLFAIFICHSLFALRFPHVPPEPEMKWWWLRIRGGLVTAAAQGAEERGWKPEGRAPGEQGELRKQQKREPEAIQSGSLHLICSCSSGTSGSSKSRAVTCCI